VRLNDIVQKVKVYQPGADTALIEKAYVFAAKCHDGQTRKSGDPYFVHPVSVAGIITEMKLDVSSICAALLHDVVEDCGITDAQIKHEFGDEIAFLVDGVTKLGTSTSPPRRTCRPRASARWSWPWRATSACWW
jgi:guanosine-3',5'-bis(diphosphate) 3'-pyrophosphohydrolase